MYNYPNTTILASADVAEMVLSGSEAATFAVAVSHITVAYVSHSCWIAETYERAVELAAGAPGGLRGGAYVRAGTIGLTIPWRGDEVWFINADSGETPEIHVIGHSPRSVT